LLCKRHEIFRIDVGTVLVLDLLPFDVLHKLLVRSRLVGLEEIVQKIMGSFTPCGQAVQLEVDILIELDNVAIDGDDILVQGVQVVPEVLGGCICVQMAILHYSYGI